MLATAVICSYGHSQHGERLSQAAYEYWTASEVDTRIFSNLFPKVIEIDGEKWNCTEAFYQVRFRNISENKYGN